MLYVNFNSNPVTIKRKGDNTGYIYNPTALVYAGENFVIMPGEKYMIIPHQPDNMGPWRQARSMFLNNRFIQSNEAKTLIIAVENRWLHKTITVTKGITLEELLDQWGIGHELSYVSDRDLEKIEAEEED
jgi:hypothetical protein